MNQDIDNQLGGYEPEKSEVVQTPDKQREAFETMWHSYKQGQRDLLDSPVVRGLVEDLRVLREATRVYFCLYMQDEAYSVHDCIDGERQHKAAKAVYEALAATKHYEGEGKCTRK